MSKIFVAIALTTFVATTFLGEAYAGDFLSYRRHSEFGAVAAAINVKEKGIYNLIVSANFLKRPADERVYKSDQYDILIDRLSVEWKGVALQAILESNDISFRDLVALKKSVEQAIQKHIDNRIKQYFRDQNVEIVFALSDFFLLEPKEQ